MNNLNTTYLLTTCLFGLVLSGRAQSDSIRTEYKTEDEAITRSEIQRVIRYITRANVEEKTLLKLGGLPNSANITQNGPYNTIGFTTELSVERKIHPSFSLLFGFDNQFLANFNQGNPYLQPGSGQSSPIWLLDRSLSINAYAKAALRYYYGMAKRIRTGQSANNFSGSYVAFQVRRPVLQYVKTRRQELQTGAIRTETDVAPLGLLNSPSVALQWGIQQRLGRHGYVDLQVGPELTIFDPNNSLTASFNNNRRTTLSLRFSAVIGLGW